MVLLICFLRRIKKKSVLLGGSLLLLSLIANNTWAQETPFKRGINLTNWFQAGSVREIQSTKYTRQDFEKIKSLGCDVIRLPINLHYMTSGAPDYTLDPLFYKLLDQPVQWAQDLELHLILDNHTFDPIANTDPNVGLILQKVWPQLAQHYQTRPQKLYYEILNEPHGISATQWNTIQQNTITAIRQVDTTHTLIVGATNYNSYHNLTELPVYDDNNLIYTFHFYDPFLFTHQGASWVQPSLVPLAQLPFPYRAAAMPGLPGTFQNTWLETAYQNYPTEGTIAQVKALIEVAAQFKATRRVPVFCGEFGVLASNSLAPDRVAWYQAVRSSLEEKNIAWTTWDYHGGFGLFEPGNQDLFEHDLNMPLLAALGFNLPAQTEYTRQPDSVGFMIYGDYTGPGLETNAYSEGILDFYATEQPNNNTYCLAWERAEQYNSIGFDFKPDKDLSELRRRNFALDLFVRGISPGLRFDIRFVDSKTSAPGDHPWRATVTLDSQHMAFDGRWHHLHLPLSAFTEQGAWDNNQWYPPEGIFDWQNIDRLEITAEHEPFNANKLWFDNILITDQDTARVRQNGTITGVKKKPGQICPSGFTPIPRSQK